MAFVLGVIAFKIALISPFALAGYALNLTTNLTEVEAVLGRVDDSTDGDYKEFFDKVNYLVAQFSA